MFIEQYNPNVILVLFTSFAVH